MKGMFHDGNVVFAEQAFGSGAERRLANFAWYLKFERCSTDDDCPVTKKDHRTVLGLLAAVQKRDRREFERAYEYNGAMYGEGPDAA